MADDHQEPSAAGEEDGPLGFGETPKPAEPDPDRYAHRRDPDLAAYGIGPDADGTAGQPRAVLPAGSSRYTWFVGVVAVLLIAYVTVNTATHKGRGAPGVAAGARAPAFAAPLASSNDDGAVNLAAKAGQGHAKIAACAIHRADAITLCDQYATKPVVLAIFANAKHTCSGTLDDLQRIHAQRSDVGIVAIAFRGSQRQARDLIAANGWTFPVGYDVDGRLATGYGVVACPQITYIRKGGIVAGTSFGEIGEAKLRERIAALVAGRMLPKDR